jgi:hypothetical protein
MGQRSANGVFECRVPSWVTAPLHLLTTPNHAPAEDAVDRFVQARSSSSGSKVALVQHAIESRYHSSILPFTLEANGGSREFLVKFPKAKMGRGFTRVPERTSEDIEVSRQERDAITALATTWQGKSSSYIAPLFYDDQTGGLVYPVIAGKDLIELPYGQVKSLAKSLGTDLASYHGAQQVTGAFPVPATMQKVTSILDDLVATSGMSVGLMVMRFLDGIRKTAGSSAALVPAIKGFELRNARLGLDRRLWLFDPGKLKTEPRETDIARFLVSCQMFFWGRARFVTDAPSGELDRAFLEAYSAENDYDRVLLDLFVTREIMKNWLISIRVTELKRIPSWVKQALIRFYVNPGFSRLLRQHLSILNHQTSVSLNGR